MCDIEECVSSVKGEEVPIEELTQSERSKYTVCVETAGCQHNFDDGERIAGRLAESGYIVVNESKEANVIVLNGCAAKTPSQDQFISAKKKYEGMGKIVVGAGCAAQTVFWGKTVKLLNLSFLTCTMGPTSLGCWEDQIH